MFTLEEANAILPKVKTILKSLRETRDRVLRIQAQIEIEEMTGMGPDGQLTSKAQTAIALQTDEFQIYTSQFEKLLDKLFRIGAHLKDLEKGLVDFYSLRDKELVFLCWVEGESKIRHWHPIEGGFKNRRLID